MGDRGIGSIMMNRLTQAQLIHHLLAFIGFYKKYRISGHSMYPLFRDGEVVYIKKTSDYNVGDIVVAEHPFRKQRIIKQIKKVDGEKIELAGLDAIESEDSRSFGAIGKYAIVGNVVAGEFQSVCINA